MRTKTLLFTLALCSFVSPSLADDSPQFRGPNRDGKSAERGLWSNLGQKEPELLWKAQGVGGGYASVSVVGDRLYTSGNSGSGQTVTALSTTDGRVIWSKPITSEDPKHDYSGSRTTPTVDGKLLYAVASSGKIVCLDTADGKLVWQRDFKDWGGRMMSGWGYSESPLVDGQQVVCTPGGKEGMIVALDKLTGKELWKTQLPDYGDETGRNGGNSVMAPDTLRS